MTVIFLVSGEIFRKEFKTPYYINENTREGLVRPFPYSNFTAADKIMGTRLRVVCKVRTRKPVWVDLVTDCS